MLFVGSLVPPLLDFWSALRFKGRVDHSLGCFVICMIPRFTCDATPAELLRIDFLINLLFQALVELKPMPKCVTDKHLNHSATPSADLM